MTALPYLSGASGDPATTRRRVAPQSLSGVPAVTGFSDFRGNGGPIVLTPGVIVRAILNATPSPNTPLAGKIKIGNGPLAIGDADPANKGLLNFVANILRKYTQTGGSIAISSITRSTTTATATVASTAALTTGDTVWITGAVETAYNGRVTITVTDGTHFTYTVAGSPSTPATGTITYSTLGYIKWLFGTGRATAAAPYLTLLSDNDVTQRARFRDVLCSQLAISAAVDQNLKVMAQVAPGEFDFHGAVSQETGSGSTLPIFSKFWSGNYSESDKAIFLKVVSAASKTMRGKIGSAASYDTVHAADSYVLGEHSRVYSEAVDNIDRRIGVFAEQVRAFWPVGATLTDGDVFKVLQNLAAWTPTLAAERPISSVSTAFILNGREIRVPGGWNLNITAAGNITSDDVAGRQSRTTRKTGQIIVTLTPTRDVIDLEFQQALMLAEHVAVVQDFVSDTEIGTSGEGYRIRCGIPQGSVSGNTYDTPEGGGNPTETITITAGIPDTPLTYDGTTFADDFGMEIRNDVEAL